MKKRPAKMAQELKHLRLNVRKKRLRTKDKTYQRVLYYIIWNDGSRDWYDARIYRNLMSEYTVRWQMKEVYRKRKIIHYQYNKIVVHAPENYL